jgi:hypothetical protein
VCREFGNDALFFSKILLVHLQNSAAVYLGRTKQEGSFKRNFHGVGGAILGNHFLFPVRIPCMNSWAGRVSEQIDAFDEAITKRRALDKSLFTGESRYDFRAERTTHRLDRARRRQGACADEP